MILIVLISDHERPPISNANQILLYQRVFPLSRKLLSQVQQNVVEIEEPWSLLNGTYHTLIGGEIHVSYSVLPHLCKLNCADFSCFAMLYIYNI